MIIFGIKVSRHSVLDKLNKEIFRLSVPAIVSNVTVPFLGLCDTAISGHLGSEIFLASIAVGTVMLNVVFWMFGFLRGGTTGLTAIAFGAKDDREVCRVLYRALFIAFSAGIILIAAQQPLFRFLRLVAGCSFDIETLVREYFNIRIWGSPALLATMAISGWFVGAQSTFYPMLIAIGMNIINIIVSFLLVFPFGLGFEGVALGTLIANWAGFAFSIGCLIWFRRGNSRNFEFTTLFKGRVWKYFAVNGNLFLRSFFIICVTMGVTAAGSRLGSLTLAINVIVMQFFQFFSFFMDGFAFSGEALVGKGLGEGNFTFLSHTARRLLVWTLITAVIFSSLYLMGTQNITSLLTDNRDVINGVADLTTFIALIPIISCWAFIFDGFYVGITDTSKMMISTFIAAIIFFCITFLRYSSSGITFGTSCNEMIWTGFLSYLLIRGLYLALSWQPTLHKYSQKL